MAELARLFCAIYAFFCCGFVYQDPKCDDFLFLLRTPIFGNIDPHQPRLSPPYGQNSAHLWLKNSSLRWGTTSWLSGISHTQNGPLGWGTTSGDLSMPGNMAPQGWGMTLVDGGHSRQQDKQYAPIWSTFREDGTGWGNKQLYILRKKNDFSTKQH